MWLSIGSLGMAKAFALVGLLMHLKARNKHIRGAVGAAHGQVKIFLWLEAKNKLHSGEVFG